jgi:phosphate transport system permease protein
MLRFFDEDIEIFNVLSAAIVTGVMVLPVVASVCDDVLRAVPQSLRAGGYALGMTRFEVVKRDVVIDLKLVPAVEAQFLVVDEAGNPIKGANGSGGGGAARLEPTATP